jgi:uncharacterized UPF0146 family protein
LKSKIIKEIKIEVKIEELEIINPLVGLFSENPRIRSIDLTLDSNEHVISIFESVKFNYIIKELRLDTSEEASEDVVKVAE